MFASDEMNDRAVAMITKIGECLSEEFVVQSAGLSSEQKFLVTDVIVARFIVEHESGRDLGVHQALRECDVEKHDVAHFVAEISALVREKFATVPQ